jgi:chromosome partitioning protein
VTSNSSIVAFASQKGGVGKTTSAINFATAVAATGKKTLIVDLDPQGNASTGLGITQAERVNSTYQVMIQTCRITDAILPTIIPLLHIIPADINLAAAEIELNALKNREFVLKDHLKELVDWDVIIIDCPPSLGLLTINALCAATGVIIPVQSEFFAMEGLAHLMRTISLVKQNYNPALKVEGILITLMDKRSKLSIAVESEVRNVFKEMVFETVIPRNVKLSEASSHGQPALIYDVKCFGSIAYAMLAREFFQKTANVNEVMANAQ